MPDAYAVMNHPVWLEIAPELTPGDFQRPESMDVEFLRRLSRMRRRAGVLFRVVSSARDPETLRDDAEKSAHNERPCKAVDLRVINNAERFAVLRAAFEEGITRIGVYAPTPAQVRQYGELSGSVHLDASTENPQERCWMKWTKPAPLGPG